MLDLFGEEPSDDVNRISIDVPVMNTKIIEYTEACRVENARRIACKIGKNARGNSEVIGMVLADTGASRMIFPYRMIKKAGVSILRERADLYRLRNASKDTMNVEGEAIIWVTPTHGSKKGKLSASEVLSAKIYMLISSLAGEIVTGGGS